MTSRGWLLLLTGCGADESVLQLVRGQLDLAGLPNAPKEIRSSDGPVTGAAPINADGYFLLGLPTGRHSLWMVAENRSVTIPVAPSPAPIEVCMPGDVWELGQLRLVQNGCQANLECQNARQATLRCEQAVAGVCAFLTSDLQSCRANEARTCAPQQERLDLCLARGFPCEMERRDLSRCQEPFDCAGRAARFIDQCVAPCATEKAAEQQLCPDLGPCNPGPLLVPARPLPERLGCVESA